MVAVVPSTVVFASGVVIVVMTDVRVADVVIAVHDIDVVFAVVLIDTAIMVALVNDLVLVVQDIFMSIIVSKSSIVHVSTWFFLSIFFQQS